MAESIKRTQANRDDYLISPDRFDAVLFDMDGVVTKTATLHCAAWKVTLDALLESRFGQGEHSFTENDYLQYIDGRQREDGVKSFLASRSLILPYGQQNDPPGFESVCAVAHLKDAEFLRLLHERGVEVYESTIRLIRHLKSAGIKVAIVTASKNGVDILQAANIMPLFDARIDGIDAMKLSLPGKPAPDLFLAAAKQLNTSPQRAIVIEDAAAGVQAGHDGGFGLVIGIARHGNPKLLAEHGADLVVHDLQEISVTAPTSPIEAKNNFTTTVDDSAETNWVVNYNQFSPVLEQQRESLCTLGNGYFATRGAAPEAEADSNHYPGTYLAGGYNSVWLDVGSKSFLREELVNLPNWLPIRFRINDEEWWQPQQSQIIEFNQRLHLKEGILYRNITFADEQGRKTSLSERRFVHMSRFHLGGQEVKLVPLNWSGNVTLRSALDGTVSNNGNQEGEQYHLEYVNSNLQNDTMSLQMITSESRLAIVEAVRTQLFLNATPATADRKNLQHHAYLAQEITLPVSQADTLTVQKTVAIYTSRDKAMSNPSEAAWEEVQSAPPFEHLLLEQIQNWHALWQQFDLYVETTDRHSGKIPSQLLHLNSFHAMQTVSENSCDLDIGIPARGWSGEGYHGHIFWDDLFVFPFITLRMPTAASSILKYRYRRLPAARAIAKRLGVSGACFPWQSGSSGKEQTPEYLWIPDKKIWIPDRSHMQIHVNAAIAYNIWQYYQATLDIAFMRHYGSEMICEIANFFASYARYDATTEKYHIENVVGPDEFHTNYHGSEKAGINDNAYTNIMAVWTLSKALYLMESIAPDRRKRLCQRLELSEKEIARWDEVSRHMYLPLCKDGVISQFRGYDQLEEFPRDKEGNIDRQFLAKKLYEQNGALNQYKIAKQADVLMLFYLLTPIEIKELFERLNYSYRYASIAINSEYYVPRTVNDSTLSRVAHAWVLSRVDKFKSWTLLSNTLEKPAQQKPESIVGSWDIFYEALGTDFFDIAARGTAKTGIHMAAMAGTLDIVQRAYTGLATLGDVLWLEPQLPDAINLLSFKLNYRDQALSFQITPDRAKVTAQLSKAKPIKIGYQTQIFTLNAGDSIEIQLQNHAA